MAFAGGRFKHANEVGVLELQPGDEQLRLLSALVEKEIGNG